MLGEIEARGFRNLAPLTWAPGPGRQLVLGSNGAGKTSLLEAVYAVATTRSFRTARMGECAAHGGPGFDLRAEIAAPRRASLAFRFIGADRIRTLNEKTASLADYLEAQPVISWTAAEGALINGAPEIRRRFLDRGVVAQRGAVIALLARYRRALTAKRHVLLTGGRGLRAWTEVLAPAAAELTALRATFCEQLQQAFDRAIEASGMTLPKVVLRYRPSLHRGLEGGLAVVEELVALEHRERRERKVLRGPHRDDLQILWGEHPARQVASAGERKALGLALVAAQGRVLGAAGRDPLYLLDDADTELDAKRLAGVFQAFDPEAQMIVTSNRPEVFEDIAITRRWWCRAGVIAASP